jgi:hypothetical protein
MRSLILSLVLGAAALGIVAATPSQAEAQRWRRWYGGYYPSYSYGYYYTAPGYSYYPYSYGSYPSYSYYPRYSYSYYYTPGSSYYYPGMYTPYVPSYSYGYYWGY